MPPQQGQKLAILQRRQRVSDLYLQGRPLHSISEELRVPMTTLWRDLKAIQKEWRSSTIRNFDEQVEQELKKLDLVEREAWEAYERSKKPAQEAHVRDNDPTRGTKRYHAGRWYYFCSLACRQKFISSPELYVGQEAPG